MGLTNYQVRWAWQAAENTAEFIGASSLAELRRGLAEELLRHYLTRAQSSTSHTPDSGDGYT